MHLTILSGDLLGNDGPNFANISENSYRVVTAIGVTQTAVLDGFTITGGNNNRGGQPAQWGGGMYVEGGDSSLGITNVVFKGNSAVAGGGLFATGGAPWLSNVQFVANRATINGGGMHTLRSSADRRSPA